MLTRVTIILSLLRLIFIGGSLVAPILIVGTIFIVINLLNRQRGDDV
jgi:hypothetical protein